MASLLGFEASFTRKYSPHRYIPSSSEEAKEDNIEERENSEEKQFFGRVELW